MSLEVGFITAMALMMCGAANAAAAQIELTPFALLRQEYTDNLFYDTAPRGMFITHISPGVRGAANSERLSSAFGARINLLHYSSESSLDNLEQFYDAGGSYRLTPRLALSASGGYRRETRPDREIESSGLALNMGSKHYLGEAGVRYQVAEETQAWISYGYDQVDYNDSTNASNVVTHTAGVGVEHDVARLLPLLRLRAGGRYSRSGYETATVDNYVATLGGSWKPHELWSLSADAGGRYTNSSFQGVTFSQLTGFGVGQQNSATTGWVAKSSLDYQGEYLSGGLSYSRDVSSTSGRQGTALERDAVLLSMRGRLNYEFSAAAGGGYYRNRAGRNQFGSGEINDTSWRGYASLRYDYSRDMAFELGYDFARLENDVTSVAVNRNKVFLQLTLQTKVFENGWQWPFAAAPSASGRMGDVSGRMARKSSGEKIRLTMHIPAGAVTLPAGEQGDVPFELINSGSETEAFRLSADMPKYLSGVLSAADEPGKRLEWVRLAPGEVFRGIIQLKMPKDKIDGFLVGFPLRAVSSRFSEVAFAGDVAVVAAAPLVRAVVRPGRQLRPASEEQAGEYHLAVLNAGSLPARRVAVSTILPEQVELVAVSGASFVRGSGGEVLLMIDRLDAGGLTELKLEVRMQGGAQRLPKMICKVEADDSPVQPAVRLASLR